MKHLLFLPVIALICLSSCSVYKNSQTPDDVYYSPPAPDAAVTYNTQPGNQGDYYSVPVSDQYVQMRVQNPDKWSYFDNYYDEAYGPYSYGSYGSTYGYSSIGLGIGFGGFGYCSPYTYYNSYYAWNSYYNPYYYGTVIVTNPKVSTPVAYTRLRPFNSGSYLNGNKGANTRTSSSFVPYSRPAQSSASFGNSLRRFFNSGSTGNGTGNGNVHTYTPSSFGGGGGGHVGGSGGGHVGGIGRPGR